jgi:competence protein ComEC
LLGLLFFCSGIVAHFYNTSSPDIRPFFKEKGSVVFRITQKLNSSEKYRKYEEIAQIKNESLNAVFYLPKNSRDLDFIHYYKGRLLLRSLILHNMIFSLIMPNI